MRMRPITVSRFSVRQTPKQCDNIGAASQLTRRTAALIGVGLFSFLVFGAALAQEPESGGEMVGRALDSMHLRAEPAPAAGFVEQARPDRSSLDYKHMAPNEKSLKKKTPAELDALGSELEGALARNRRAAARVKIPDTQAKSVDQGKRRQGD